MRFSFQMQRPWCWQTSSCTNMIKVWPTSKSRRRTSLFNQRGLDKEVARYAAWRLDRDQEAFFDKVRTIHQTLCEALEYGLTRKQRLSVKDLLGLEREVYIFFSMIHTIVGRSVLRSAVAEYGSPESDLYFLKESDRFMSHLLQNLRIAIRGAGQHR